MRMKVGAAVGALLAVVSGLVIGAGPAQADPGCPSMYVVAVPGTWETSDKGKIAPGNGMLGFVTRGLGPKVDVDYVSYAATAFPWETEVYGRSKKQAVDHARALATAMVQRCGDTKIALLGYSQGADAAGDLAAEIGTGLTLIPANRVAAVGLISDPRRSPTDMLVGPSVPGAGAGGPRIGGFGFVTPVVRSICAPGDLYCATAQDDFVTRFAGFLAQSSDPNPANYARYQQEGLAIFNDLMAFGGVPLLQNQLSDQANLERRRQLEKFYGEGAHTDYGAYTVEGVSATTWMANYFRSRI